MRILSVMALLVAASLLGGRAEAASPTLDTQINITAYGIARNQTAEASAPQAVAVNTVGGITIIGDGGFSPGASSQISLHGEARNQTATASGAQAIAANNVGGIVIIGRSN